MQCTWLFIIFYLLLLLLLVMFLQRSVQLDCNTPWSWCVLMKIILFFHIWDVCFYFSFCQDFMLKIEWTRYCGVSLSKREKRIRRSRTFLNWANKRASKYYYHLQFVFGNSNVNLFRIKHANICCAITLTISPPYGLMFTLLWHTIFFISEAKMQQKNRIFFVCLIDSFV